MNLIKGADYMKHSKISNMAAWFDLYPLNVVSDDIRDKLIAKGIPAEEIAYIHDAKTEQQKADLFDKVRSGEIRVLLGSTAKMGTGTNVQKKLIAVHDLDIPWRPADLERAPVKATI